MGKKQLNIVSISPIVENDLEGSTVKHLVVVLLNSYTVFSLNKFKVKGYLQIEKLTSVVWFQQI